MSTQSAPPPPNAPGFTSEHPLEFTIHSTPSCCVGNLNGAKGIGLKSHSRAGTLRLPHGSIRTPVFMPVGTKGTIKGLSSQQLYHPALNPEIILGNTYHLGLQPGTEVVARAGGLHSFMNWRNNLLTDSGGFQMVSLLDLAEITEQGVRFASPLDGSQMMLTPEESIRYQNNIGADIMMQLDDVVGATTSDDARFLEAMHRSVRWLDRCIAAHSRPGEQNLFAIIQGGLDVSPGGLRDLCLDEMVQRNLPGYAIGGLAGGEDKNIFWKVVAYCTARLPAHKPRYLMGVGYPVDLVVCVALGVDMFDCVFPTRTARFGVALVAHSGGSLRLKAKEFASDTSPIEEGCGCPTCASCTRAYLHSLLKENDALAAQYVTMHNVAYMMRLMRTMREAMLAGPAAYERYINEFLAQQYPRMAKPAADGKTPGETIYTSAAASSDNADEFTEPELGERVGAEAKRRKLVPAISDDAAENVSVDTAGVSARAPPGWVLDALTYAGIHVTYDL